MEEQQPRQVQLDPVTPSSSLREEDKEEVWDNHREAQARTKEVRKTYAVDVAFHPAKEVTTAKLWARSVIPVAR